MLLPEGFDRDNGKMYEEVNIPSSTDAPTGVGKKLINIAELDEVGGGWGNICILSLGCHRF